MKLSSMPLKAGAVAACAFGLSLASSFAAHPRGTRLMRGTIKLIDTDAHTLIVTEHKDNSEHKLLWNDQTRFMEHGRAATASDLKADEQVRITCPAGAEPSMMQQVRIAPARAESPDTAAHHSRGKSKHKGHL